jgi:hypothetical protein
MYDFDDIEYKLRKASIQWYKQKNDIPVVPLHVALEIIVELKKKSIEWSEYDFETRASDTHGPRKWRKIYDPSKFGYALEVMIKDHDCNNGITWDTIDYYLGQYCLI